MVVCIYIYSRDTLQSSYTLCDYYDGHGCCADSELWKKMKMENVTYIRMYNIIVDEFITMRWEFCIEKKAPTGDMLQVFMADAAEPTELVIGVMHTGDGGGVDYDFSGDSDIAVNPSRDHSC